MIPKGILTDSKALKYNQFQLNTNFYPMKTVDKSQLKANLLEFLQLVELEGEEILVMDGNKPVVRISQYEKTVSTEELFKDMRGKIKYFEHLTTPTTEEWQEV